MKNNKNNQAWEEHKNQDAQTEGRGSKEETNSQQAPDNRLKDGTNDFANGDQEPTSERASDANDQSRGA